VLAVADYSLRMFGTTLLIAQTARGLGRRAEGEEQTFSREGRKEQPQSAPKKPRSAGRSPTSKKTDIFALKYL
jgi:hypothetical protein